MERERSSVRLAEADSANRATASKADRFGHKQLSEIDSSGVIEWLVSCSSNEVGRESDANHSTESLPRYVHVVR